MLTLHASAVAWDSPTGRRGALITGPSGSGKSALALQLLAYGCGLVADDATILTLDAGHIVASAPDATLGMIEARGVGLLNAPAAPAPVTLCISMEAIETDRLPPWRSVTYLGLSLPLLHKRETGHFAAAVLQYLKQGRRS